MEKVVGSSKALFWYVADAYIDRKTRLVYNSPTQNKGFLIYQMSFGVFCLSCLFIKLSSN